MKMLALSVEGIAYHPYLSEVVNAVPESPGTTGQAGVYYWRIGQSIKPNHAATAYLRSCGVIAPSETVLGAIVFACLDGNRLPSGIPDDDLEAFGWAVARAIIAPFDAARAVA